MAESGSDHPKAVFLQSIIDAIPEITVVIDRNCRIRYANQAARQSAENGDPVDSAQACHEFFYGTSVPCEEAGRSCLMKKVVETRDATTVERLHHDHGGNTVHMEISASPIFDDDGEVQQIIEIWRDITERKRARQALQASEQTYRVLFERSADATLIIDDNRFVDCNDAVVEMLRYGNKADLLKTHPSELSPDFQPDGQSSYEKADEMMAIAFEKGSHRFEWDHKRADGEVFPVEVLLTAIPVGGKKILHCVWRDITDRKQAEQEREELIANLESQNAELERFAYTVSHDLKSPLVTVKGFLGLLRTDLADGNHEAITSDVERLESAANQMTLLLSDLLELSRIGRVVNEPESIDFAQLARDAEELVSGQIAESGTRVDIKPDLPVVVGDRQRLLEVMQNLLDNAVKYMGKQPAPAVEIGCRHCDHEVVFYVKDNGIGIDPEFHDRIFGLFDQLDRSSDGSGVGLALVKRIVELHGGRIWVESEGPGCGSTFCFTLAMEGADTGKNSTSVQR